MSKLKLTGLFVVAVALIALVGCKNNKNAEQASYNDDTLHLPTESYSDFSDDLSKSGQAATDVADNTTAANTANATEEPVMTEDKEGNLSEAPTSKVNESNVFYIVAGSFTLYNNAQKLNTKLKAKGYDSKILEPYGQYHRVTVKQFSTVAEARAALPGLRKNIDQTLWLLTR